MDFSINIWQSFLALMRTFTIIDLIDIIIVAFLMYGFIKLIRDTRAEQLVKGLLILVFAYMVSYQLNFRMLSTILNNFYQFGLLTVIVVFQPELRRALEHIGRNKIGDYWSIGSMLNDGNKYFEKMKQVISTVSKVCGIFSRARVGALIVFERKTKLGDIIDTGTVIKAIPSMELIGNIFFNKAPLHDGAMIIKDGMVYAGGCILPLTKNETIGTELGTRHRAAIGISENSDAVVVVVSEETGCISVVINGVLTKISDEKSLRAELEALLIQGNKDLPLSVKNIMSSFKRSDGKGEV